MKYGVIAFMLLCSVVCYGQTAEEFVKMGNEKAIFRLTEEAIADYTKAIIMDSNLIEAYIKRGNLKFDSKEWGAALADYSKIMEINSKYVDLFYNRGLLKSLLGNKNGAIADFTKAIESYPYHSDVLAYGKRGDLKSELGDTSGALVDFIKAFDDHEIYKCADDYINEYGRRIFQGRNYGDGIYGDDKFLAEIRKGIKTGDEINPNSDIYANGLRRFEIGDSKSAIIALSKFIEFFPKSSQAYSYRGMVYYLIGDMKKAITDFNNVLKLEPSATWFLLRGNAKFSLGDKRGAVADYNRAIEVEPGNAGVYYNLGLTKLVLRDKEGGCLDLSKAGELGYERAYRVIQLFCQ